MRAVGEGIPVLFGMRGKGLQIPDLECQMCEVGADLHGPACVVFADFDEFLAAGSFEENKLGAATAGRAPHLFKTKDGFVKVDGFFQVVDPVAGVEKFFDHGFYNLQQPGSRARENFAVSIPRADTAQEIAGGGVAGIGGEGSLQGGGRIGWLP
jgi:hypothetical protein